MKHIHLEPHLISKSVIPSSSVVNVSYRLRHRRTMIHCQCDRIRQVRFHTTGEALTNQHPELVSKRQVPVLYHFFRKEGLCCRSERTARKIANTIKSSTNDIQQVIPPAYPMISYHAKRIRSFTGGTISVGKRDRGGMAYLVCQCQEVVIDEQSCDRHRMILTAIPE